MKEKKRILKIDDVEKLNSIEIRDLYSKYVNTKQSELFYKLSYGKQILSSAEGMYIFTKDNQKILDFTGGIGVLNLGHNHPRILKTRIDFQNKKKLEVNKLYFSPYTAVLANNLANILPGNLEKSFFTNSGAEAVEGALKIAYKFHDGERNIVLHSNISFHGNLIGSGSISGRSEYKENFPVLNNTDSFKYGDIKSVEEKILKHTINNQCKIYALIIEPFHAASLSNCSKEFLINLQKICKKNKIILIFDEVYVGWGKTGSIFYFMRYDEVIPDILTTSKSFGGGKSSISAYITSDDVFQKAYGTANDAFLHSTTYNGFGEECATAIEAINIIIEEDYPNKAKKIEKLISFHLNELKKTFPKQVLEIKGQGALFGIILHNDLSLIEKLLKNIPIKFVKDKKSLIIKLPYIALIDYLYSKFKILTHITPNYEIFLITPSLVVNEKEINYFFDSLNQCFKKGMKKIIFEFIVKYLKN